jgi:ribosomal protein S18 acetylase RimI-like enzyme
MKGSTRRDIRMIDIRPAQPEDVEAAAQLLYISERAVAQASVYDFIFPGSMKERLEKIAWLYLNGYETVNYYERYKVAEIDGEVASILCTSVSEDDKLGHWFNALRRMGFSRLEFAAMLWRIRFYWKVDIRFPDNILIIGNVATFPRFRRQGTAKVLLEDALAQARREGYDEIQLSVMIGNDAAQEAYEKMGFKVLQTKTSPALEKKLGCTGYHRMSLKLQGQYLD